MTLTHVCDFNDSRRRFRNRRGNLMVLMAVAAVALLVLLVFGVNYVYILQQGMVGRTAAEAAALQAAVDMARVTVNLPGKGPISLVDQPGNSINDRPILGVNTRLGIIRLDYVIAAKLGNTTMQYLALQDLAELKKDYQRLNVVLNNPSQWVDRQGRSIDVIADCEQVYKNNLRLNNRNFEFVPNSLQIRLGEARANLLTTNIPIPKPDSADLWLSQEGLDNFSVVVENERVYKAYTPIGVRGSTFEAGEGKSGSFPSTNEVFTFTAVGKQPSLIANADFISTSGSVPPSIVQVSAREFVKRLDNKGARETQQITQRATAQAGGTLMSFPTGALCVGFPSGLPLADLPPTGNIFQTVRSMMNWSMPDVVTPDTDSPSVGWNKDSIGHWFEAVGGPIGSTGNIGKFKHTHVFHGRHKHDDPSVALSIAVYDWIKTLGLRPNVVSIFRALNGGSDQRSLNVPHQFSFYNYAQQAPGSHQLYSFSLPWGFRPVHADSREPSSTADVYQESIGQVDANISGADMALMPEARGGPDLGMRDPRFILNHQTTDAKGRGKQVQDSDQTALAFGDTSHAVVAPPDATNLAVSKDNTITSADGRPLDEVVSFENALVYSSQNSVKSWNSGHEVMQAVQRVIEQQEQEKAGAEKRKAIAEKELADLLRLAALEHSASVNQSRIQQLHAIIAEQTSQIASLTEEIAIQMALKQRAQNVKDNAVYINSVIQAVNHNKKILTGIGVARQNTLHFILAGANFWPIPKAALAAEIRAGGVLSTGQDASCSGVMDWTAPLSNSKSQLLMYKRAAIAGNPSVPQIGFRGQPAHAAVTGIPPANQRMFIFSVAADGSVRMAITASSPFAQTSVLEGQFLYQNTLGVSQDLPDGGKLFWLVTARDENANPQGTYFADRNAPGNVVSPRNWCKSATFGGTSSIAGDCQHVVTEFRISCPIAQPNGACVPIQTLQADGAQGDEATCPPPPPCGS